MISSAATSEEFFASLPDGRKVFVNTLRTVILEHSPEDFEESMS